MEVKIKVWFSLGNTRLTPSLKEEVLEKALKRLQEEIGPRGHSIEIRDSEICVGNLTELINDDGFARDIYSIDLELMEVTKLCATLEPALLAASTEHAAPVSSFQGGEFTIVTGLHTKFGSPENFRTPVKADPVLKRVSIAHECRPSLSPEQNVNVFLAVLDKVKQNIALTKAANQLVQAIRSSNKGMVGRSAKELYKAIDEQLPKR